MFRTVDFSCGGDGITALYRFGDIVDYGDYYHNHINEYIEGYLRGYGDACDDCGHKSADVECVRYYLKDEFKDWFLENYDDGSYAPKWSDLEGKLTEFEFGY